METTNGVEGVHCVYNKSELVAIIKRDEASKKRLVFLVREATEEEIYDLIKK